MPTSEAPHQAQDKSRLLRYTGHGYFRQRLVLATLSGRAVRIDAIRPDDEEPGIREFEAGFLRLLEKVTNGSHVEISYTGTSVLYRPGVIAGGVVIHDCGTARPIGYFLEGILCLAPFGKKELNLTLKGITTGEGDLSADLLRTVTLPHLQLFGIEDGLELRIKKRGSAPLGGGEIQFRCPAMPSVRTLNFVEPGRVKRIRGIAHATRVSPQMANRMIEAARGVLNRYIPDIYLFADVYRGEDSGKSPGFALTLVSSSTTGALHASEAISSPGITPEEVATVAARALLQEIGARGCVDRSHQWLVLLFMVLGSEDVGRARMGPLTPHSIQFLRDLRDFFGTTFKIRPVPSSRPSSNQDEDEGQREQDEVIVSCLGTAFRGFRKVG